MQEWNARKTDEMSVDLMRLVRAVWKKVWLVVLAVGVFGVAAYLYSSLLITPTYRSSFTAYVNNRQNTENINSTNTSDLNASIGLTYVYKQIISSRSVLMDAAESCGIQMPYSSLAGKVSTSISDKAAIITVYVEDTDPERAALLATAIAEVAPDHVARVVEGSSMRIIDAPVQPTRKYAPSNSRNAIVGAIIGMLLALVGIVVMELIDDKVRSGEDLESRYQIPVIGTIPDMLQAEKSRDKYGYRKGGYGYK